MQKILNIDLSTGTIDTFSVPAEWERDYLGGASLAARVLYDRLAPVVDPFSEQAPLLFLTGPLTGTSGPAVGRFVVCGRSPATRLWAESNCGGFWGVELRRTGHDGILLTGRADKPVILRIANDEVQLLPAGHLWGSDTYQTQSALKTELGSQSLRVASIGLAGENRLPFASILCDHGRMAGRTGLGAVMGAKNLKAIAVAGSAKIPLADPARYAQIRTETNRLLRSDGVSDTLRSVGTAGAMDYFDYLGDMPKRYFQDGRSHEELQTTGAVMAETILAGVSACHACVIACGRVVRMEDGEKRKGPEYETLAGFGANLGLNDLGLAVRLGDLCDRYGMDSISASNTIGLAFKLYQEGIITQADTGGLALEWGAGEVVESLVHQIARREGIGEYLAEGARGLGRRFGVEELAIQVNGLEVPYHDPRGTSGMALVYATSPRGACHNQSDYFLVDIGQADEEAGLEYYEPHAGAEKAANVARHQDWRTVFNALVMCLFSNIAPHHLVELVNAACGQEWSLDEIMLSGERGWNLKRLINLRLGLTRQDDRLPEGLLKPFQDDPEAYAPPFEAMLAAYYEARGWDPASGKPKKEKLVELGLDSLVVE